MIEKIPDINLWHLPECAYIRILTHTYVHTQVCIHTHTCAQMIQSSTLLIEKAIERELCGLQSYIRRSSALQLLVYYSY